MIIEVLPLPDDSRWGVFARVGDYVLLVGTSKHSFDCDFHAEQLAKGHTNVQDRYEEPNEIASGAMKEFLMMDRSNIEVQHHPEDRARLQTQQETNKKKARKDAKERDSA
jgi:hypothetical protein